MKTKIFLSLIILFSFVFADYQIAPGDKIEVVFNNNSHYTTKQTVDLDGNINLPFLEMIKVQGMTRTELQTHLNNNYAKYLKNDTPLVYIEARPIYIIWHDLKNNKTETTVAKNVEEAKAICGKYYKGSISPGQVIHIEQGKPHSWLENNWYKLLSALSIVIALIK